VESYEAVERNLRHAMRCFAKATPESEIRDMPGVLITNAAVESPVFNAAMLNAPVSEGPMDLDRRVAIAKVYFDARGLPWSFWICEDLAPPPIRRRLQALLAERNLHRSAVCPGMMAAALPPPRRQLPVLDVQPVGDVDTRLAFCHITSVCFRIPFETSVAIYNVAETWRTDFKAFVAYWDGVPAATAATVTAAGVTGLYSVATLPEQRGRGIAEQLTRYVLEEANHDGADAPLVLQATRQGTPLYKKLGFREVTKISVYVAR
jgi:GNAT superfamily N-acetyltransferase